MTAGILIEVSPGETRAAIVDDDDRLVELLVERVDRPPLEGGIHLGRLTRIEPSLNGAFVALADGQDGFLRQAKGMHEGQSVVVQVMREPSGKKGATLTDRPRLIGRYLTLTPNRKEVTYSRKLGSGRRRAQLEGLAERLRAEVGHGLVFRAAAAFAEDKEIAAEAARLRKEWDAILEASDRGQAPICLAKPADLLTRVLRDRYGGPVVIDNPLSFRMAEALVATRIPDWRGLLQRYDDIMPLFDAYGIADKVESVCDRIVTLPSGLRLTIDPVEAMTVIDVDSGAGGRRAADDAILRINHMALSEAVRQVRLRNISGLVVIDFLNMRKTSVRRQFLQTARKAFRDDPMQVDVLGLTAAGVLELTRRRAAPPLHEFLIETAAAQPAATALACASLRAVLRLTGPGTPVITAPYSVIKVLETSLASACREVDRRMGQNVRLHVDALRSPWDVMMDRE